VSESNAILFDFDLIWYRPADCNKHVGATPSTWNFWLTGPLERNHRFSVDIRS